MRMTKHDLGPVWKHMVPTVMPGGTDSPKLDFDVFSTGSRPCVQNPFCFRELRRQSANNHKGNGAGLLFTQCYGNNCEPKGLQSGQWRWQCQTTIRDSTDWPLSSTANNQASRSVGPAS